MADDCVPAGSGDHVVKPGESLVSIAARSGLLPDTIWNDAANDALKQARKSAEVLLPGDRLTVMAVRVKKETGATGKRHVFVRKGVPVKFTLVLLDPDGEPFASKKYELVIDGKKITGTADDQGKIECSIDPRAKEGRLSVWLEEPGFTDPWERDISLATLYPCDHIIGIQQRLTNLGLYYGELDGEAGPATLAAITAFQVEQGLTANATIDQTFKDKLVEVHKI
jgi:hypothetical protein